MNKIGAAIVFALISTVAQSALALEITSCGQTVPSGEVGMLTADLICAPTDLLGVGLETGATLNLNGFTLSGGDNIAVRCRSRTCGGDDWNVCTNDLP